MQTVQQVFPRREGNRIAYQKWEPDLKSAQRICNTGMRKRLCKEVEEMSAHLPRWILTVVKGRNTIRCKRCGGLLVFDRGLRCVACGKARSVADLDPSVRLAFFGLLPPIGIDGLPKIKAGLAGHTPKRHIVGHSPEIGTYLLVPLVAVFPPEYPVAALAVAYQPGFFSIPYTPSGRASHEVHMVGGEFMCLFAARQWSPAMTCREVLQQRAYPHVIKMLNYAAGKRDAFAIVS